MNKPENAVAGSISKPLETTKRLDQKAIETLRYALHGPPVGAEEAARALEDAGLDVIPYLEKELASSDYHVRQLALRIQFRIRLKAANVQATGGNSPGLELLRKSLQESDSRIFAAIALGRIGDTSAVEPLCEILSTQKHTLGHAEVIEALSVVKDPRSVETLCTILCNNSKDSDLQALRPLAAKALSAIADIRAVEPLGQALRTRYPPQHYFGKDYSSELKMNALESLARFGGTRSVDIIIEQLEQAGLMDDLPRKALVKIGGDYTTDALLGLLKAENRDTRWNAIKALAQIGDMRAFEPLCQALADRDEFMRGAAASALGDMGDIRAFEALVPLINNRADRRVMTQAFMRLLGAKTWSMSESSKRQLIAALNDHGQWTKFSDKTVIGNDEETTKNLIRIVLQGSGLHDSEAVNLFCVCFIIVHVHEGWRKYEDIAFGKRRAEAIQKLSESRQPLFGDLFAAKLDDGSIPVHFAAASALLLLGDFRGIRSLVSILTAKPVFEDEQKDDAHFKTGARDLLVEALKKKPEEFPIDLLRDLVTLPSIRAYELAPINPNIYHEDGDQWRGVIGTHVDCQELSRLSGLELRLRSEAGQADSPESSPALQASHCQPAQAGSLHVEPCSKERLFRRVLRKLSSLLD